MRFFFDGKRIVDIFLEICQLIFDVEVTQSLRFAASPGVGFWLDRIHALILDELIICAALGHETMMTASLQDFTFTHDHYVLCASDGR